MPTRSTPAAPRIGLVLGGGGTAGHAYHTGVLAAMRQLTGWDARSAHVVVGTSAGSGVAAMLRGGVAAESILERILSLPTDPAGMARLREISGRDGAGSAVVVVRSLLAGVVRSRAPAWVRCPPQPTRPVDAARGPAPDRSGRRAPLRAAR